MRSVSFSDGLHDRDTVSRDKIYLEFLSFRHAELTACGRALDCRAGGRGFDSRDRTNTQGLKITVN